MRTLRLAQVAAEAEGLRLRRRVRRLVIRAVLFCIAGFFLAVGIGFVHLAIWQWLIPLFGALHTALILAGGDAVIALVFAAFAARSTPDRIEVEARLVREQAIQSMRRSFDFWAMLMPVAQLVATISRRRRGRD
jgi:hypothetical protein